MAFRFVVLATLLAVANAGLLPATSYAHLSHIHSSYEHGAPAEAALTKAHEADFYDPHPKYSFAYQVHDSHTGDAKSQEESRDGDVVTGHYSFIEADGSRRVVHYTADHHNGFNAVVSNEPSHLAAPTAHVQPFAYHAQPAPQPTYKFANNAYHHH